MAANSVNTHKYTLSNSKQSLTENNSLHNFRPQLRASI
jgi:hypothetical protein